MPIYEFYCPQCHMIFNFFSTRVETDRRPDCPRCGRPRIDRRMSVFAVLKGASEDDQLPDVDEAALNRAVSALAENESALDGDDPKAAAGAMREFYRAGGLKLGAGVEEYIRRLEAGQDPEAVDAELGHVLDQEDPFLPRPAKSRPGPNRPPAKDDKLYWL